MSVITLKRWVEGEDEQREGHPSPGEPAVSEAGYVLEEGRRLSESILWKLQREFYDQQGIQAWNTGTLPFYITSNPFMARAYAHVVLGFLRDCCAHRGFSAGSTIVPLDPRQPVFILELGSGSGRLGYLFLKRLLALKSELALHEIAFRYVMTDFTESNLRFWNTHPSLQPFLEEGVLDFALFDVEQKRELTLVRSGEVLSAATVRNPIVVVANYIFDTLSQDAFRVEGGEILEGRVTTLSPPAGGSPLTDPGSLEQITLHARYSPVREDSYEVPEWNRILNTYRERLSDTSLLFPIGALRGVQNLLDLSGNRLLLLSADKGYSEEDELLGWDDLSLAIHGGCFSMMVNYHALKLYFDQQGGLALSTSPWDTTLVVAAFLLGGPPSAFPETRLAFREAVEGFSPYHFYALIKNAEQDGSSLSLEHILCLLRLSEWDPYLILHFAQMIRNSLGSATRPLERELHQALERVWDHYFPIGEKEDLPFEIALIFHGLKRPKEALCYYRHSLQMFGEHPITLYNMGLCCYYLGQPEEALRYFDRSLHLDARYGPAREWRIRVQAELGGEGRLGDPSVGPGP